MAALEERRKQLERQLEKAKHEKSQHQKLKTRLLELASRETQLVRKTADLEQKLEHARNERCEASRRLELAQAQHKREIDAG